MLEIDECIAFWWGHPTKTCVLADSCLEIAECIAFWRVLGEGPEVVKSLETKTDVNLQAARDFT